MSTLVYQTLPADQYSERYVSYLKKHHVVNADGKDLFNYMTGSSSDSLITSTIAVAGAALRDSCAGLENSLYFRLDSAFEEGYLDRYLTPENDYVYFLKSTDGSLDHLPDDIAMDVRKGLAYTNELLGKALSDVHPYQNERSDAVQFLLNQHAAPIMTTINQMSYYVDRSKSDLYQDFVHLLLHDKALSVEPVFRLRAQWIASNIMNQCPDIIPELKVAWEALGFKESFPESVKAKHEEINEILLKNGWRPIGKDFGNNDVWAKPLVSRDGESRQDTLIYMKEIGNFLNISSPITPVQTTVGPQSDLNGFCGFQYVLDSIHEPMLEFSGKKLGDPVDHNTVLPILPKATHK